MDQLQDTDRPRPGESRPQPAPDEGTSDLGSDQIASAIRGLDPGDKESIRILVVDDDHTLCKSCTSVLDNEGYDVHAAERGSEALDLLKNQRFDIVLLDLYMSGVSGSELLKERLDRFPETLVIIMTGNPSVESSVEVLRRGAWSYLPKPFSASHLQVLVGRAAHAVLVARQSRREREAVRGEDMLEDEDGLTILGASKGFRDVVDLARKVASTDASVFIVGESGVGKDLIAQYIHRHSRRRSKSFVPVNCAALPESLLESEMFGHVEGAFTGAVRDKPGLLEEAHGGTLFLDELTAMSAPIQAKLLRVLQDGVVRRVGSTTPDAVVNVRFLVATNQDPLKEMEKGRLRTDLYYRLRVVPIVIPPLRERTDDIPILARHFLSSYWETHRGGSGRAPTLTDAAIRALRSHPWPGNVRELKNTIEHAVVLLQPGTEIQPHDIPFITDDLERASTPEITSTPSEAPEEPAAPPSEQTVSPSDTAAAAPADSPPEPSGTTTPEEGTAAPDPEETDGDGEEAVEPERPVDEGTGEEEEEREERSGGAGGNGAERWKSTPTGPRPSYHPQMPMPAFDPEEEFSEARDKFVAEFERRYLIEAVRWADGNISKAARTMGIHRTYLYRLLDKHDLDHVEIRKKAKEEEAAAAERE